MLPEFQHANIAGNALDSYAGVKGLQNALDAAPQQGGQNALSGDDIGSRLMGDLMRDFGLTAAEAAGIVGNLAHESGGFNHLQEINPMVPGSRGGYGYAQWTGPRRRQFEEWAQGRGLDPASYDANYGFLKYELTNTPESSVLGGIVGPGNADTADDVTRYFSEKFLRPGIPGMDSRLAYTRKYSE